MIPNNKEIETKLAANSLSISSKEANTRVL